MAKKKCYLASANTSEGFVSFFDNIIENADRVYIIKGGPGCGKSTFIKKIGEELLNSDFNVDFVYCSADMDSLDAIFIHDVNIAVIDGTAPHVALLKINKSIEILICFTERLSLMSGGLFYLLSFVDLSILMGYTIINVKIMK